MYCNNCGAQIIDGEKFCRWCGSPVEQQESANTQTSKKNNTKSIAIAVSLLVAVAILVSVFFPQISILIHPQVYKFYTISASGESADWETTFGVFLIQKILEGSFLEIKSDKTINFYSTISGYQENIGFSDVMADASDEDSDISVKMGKDTLTILCDYYGTDITIVFVKASKQEIQAYNALKKQ